MANNYNSYINKKKMVKEAMLNLGLLDSQSVKNHSITSEK